MTDLGRNREFDYFAVSCRWHGSFIDHWQLSENVPQRQSSATTSHGLAEESMAELDRRLVLNPPSKLVVIGYLFIQSTKDTSRVLLGFGA